MITAESKISDVIIKIPNYLVIFRKYWNKELNEVQLKYYGMLKIQFYNSLWALSLLRHVVLFPDNKCYNSNRFFEKNREDF